MSLSTVLKTKLVNLEPVTHWPVKETLRKLWYKPVNTRTQNYPGPG